MLSSMSYYTLLDRWHPDCRAIDRQKPVHTCFRNQDTLYPETGDFVAVSDNEVAWNGNKISCFGIQSILFVSETSVDRP